MLHFACPASGEGSSAQAPPWEASCPSKEVQDATLLRTVHHSASGVLVTGQTIPPPSPLSSSHPPLDPAPFQDKGKEIVEDTGKVAARKKKASAAARGLMIDA